MRTISVGVLFLFVCHAAFAADVVVVCPVTGVIDDGNAALIARAVQEASSAKALILEIDTPGGQIDSALKIANTIKSAPCRTIAYATGMGAISAGALISYSCTDIIMSPEAAIGAATPVIASPEGMMPTGEKEVSFMRAEMRAKAESHNRNPAIAEAMVDKDIELWSYTDAQGAFQIVAVYPNHAEPGVGDVVKKAIDSLPSDLNEIKKIAKDALPATPDAPKTSERPANVPADAQLIKPAGKLLTLTAKEALKYQLISATAASIQDVTAQYTMTDVQVRRLRMTLAEQIFRILTNPVVAGILLMLGIGGLYLEMKTPGVSLPGVIGVVCLVLLFGSHLLLGIAEWIDVLLVVIGIGLILAEIFVLPGHMIMGVSGMVCILAGLYLTLTGVTVPQYSWEFDRLRNAGVSLGIAFATLALFVYLTWKLFPHTPFYNKIVQVHVQERAQGYVVQSDADQALAIGRRGIATSMLRPAGRGRFGDTTLQVVSRGEFISPGSPIMIVQVDGNRYVVDTFEEKS